MGWKMIDSAATMAGQKIAVTRSRMPSFPKICEFCISGGVPRRSAWVAVLVGSLLNLINQGDALLTGGHINVMKLVLTYAVPYCVATYGAVSYRLQMERPESSGTRLDTASE
jgi:hypothetical protein